MGFYNTAKQITFGGIMSNRDKYISFIYSTEESAGSPASFMLCFHHHHSSHEE